LITDNRQAGLEFELEGLRGSLGQEELVAEGFEEGEVAGVVGDADAVGRAVAGVGGDEVEVVAIEGDRVIAEGVGEAGDAMVLSGEGAGDGEADFVGQGGVGFGEAAADVFPGIDLQSFRKGLALDEEFGPGGVEDLLGEGRGGGDVDVLAVGEADSGILHCHFF